MKIQKVAVLGSGVMGAQIASLLSAAGLRVFLYDLPTALDKTLVVGSPEFKAQRSQKSLQSLQKLSKLKPSPLYSQEHLDAIEACNFEDDRGHLASCQWIIEAVAERVDIKHNLFRALAPSFNPDAIVSTNTSGIFLKKIAESLPSSFHKNFFGTHFFNPPRYMKLLELIPFESTDLKQLKAFAEWSEENLGKGVVIANDTINFIANRIGTFCSHSAMRAMEELSINVETVDELTGVLIGRSKSATFRTADIVGLDTGAAVAMNNYKYDEADPYRSWFLPPPWFANLVERGHLGQKAGGLGIYKKTKDATGATKILAYRSQLQDYAPLEIAPYPWLQEAKQQKDIVKRIKTILSHQDPGAEFVWRNLRDLFAYASYFVGPIADGNVRAVDEAMRWGFNWQMGPFELWQALGYDAVLQRMKADKVVMGSWLKPNLTFYQMEGHGVQSTLKAPVKGQESTKMIPSTPRSYEFRLPLHESTEDPRIVFKNASASLVDLKDGVACLVFHSKMNTVNPQITDLIEKSLDKVVSDFKALVISNDGPHFSAGADIRDFMAAINSKKFAYIDTMEKAFHQTMCRLKFAPFPIVACPTGLTLGGGCEVSLHTSAQVIGAETIAGLVEAGVGLLPAGGGTKELALRAYDWAKFTETGDPLPFLLKAFWLIALARKSTSGFEALEMGLYAPLNAKVSLSREHLTWKAKSLALSLDAQGFQPKIPRQKVKVIGQKGISVMEKAMEQLIESGQWTPYDQFIGTRVARILCGGEVPEGSLRSEADFLDLERIYFVELCQQPKTIERIEYMLKNGQALKN